MPRQSLKGSFFNAPTLEVAKKLLGCTLTSRIGGRETSGIIVEVEAYHETDPAAHCYGGQTARNAVMFGPPGRFYVYFIYGMHYCVNVVTEKEGTGAAVLIRALEPLTGIETMIARRGCKDRRSLTNGPAKLCEALGIDRRVLGEDVRHSKLLRLRRRRIFKPAEISVSRRVGISRAAEYEWRFYVAGNRCVSRR